jgi:hypothetical protein
MNNAIWKPWIIGTLTIAVAGIVIRSIWQIVVITTPGTMLIFIPLILALVGANALLIYIVARPERLTNLFSLTIITLVLTGGLIAGVTHFVNFIISDLAHHFWSKVISACVLSSSVSAYFLIIWFLWSLRIKRQRHG